MQQQLEALDSIISQLVGRTNNLHQENEALKQKLAETEGTLSQTQEQLASTQNELAETRKKLEDTGLQIGLMIEQLTKDTNIEPVVSQADSEVAN